MPETLRIGLDIGSTTLKCVVLNEADKIIYSCYERHLSLIAQKTRELLTRLNNEVVHGAPVRLSISGSAGMGLALGSHISFVQEVYATAAAVTQYYPDQGRGGYAHARHGRHHRVGRRGRQNPVPARHA